MSGKCPGTVAGHFFREPETGRSEKNKETQITNHAFSSFLARLGKPSFFALSARFWRVWGGFRGLPGVLETLKIFFDLVLTCFENV
jgi:hypothetical protein